MFSGLFFLSSWIHLPRVLPPFSVFPLKLIFYVPPSHSDAIYPFFPREPSMEVARYPKFLARRHQNEPFVHHAIYDRNGNPRRPVHTSRHRTIVPRADFACISSPPPGTLFARRHQSGNLPSPQNGKPSVRLRNPVIEIHFPGQIKYFPGPMKCLFGNPNFPGQMKYTSPGP